MTALCGGAASSAKPGALPLITLGAAFVDFLLTKYGFGLLIPFVSAIESPVFAAATNCTSDPPALPTWTDDDTYALLHPLASGIDWQGTVGKVQDLLYHLTWLESCQCATGFPVQPPSPPPLPPNLPVQVGQTGTVAVPMLAKDTRVLNLWTGTTNATPPTGWDAVNFNDSAWNVGTQVTPTGAVTPGSNTTQGINPQCLGWKNMGGQLVAPGPTPTSGKEEFLVRWRFTLPQVFDVTQLCVQFWHLFAPGGVGGWSTGSVTINGVSSFPFNNAANWAGHFNDFRPGQNTMALWINSGNTGGANTWGTQWGISGALSIAGSAATNDTQGCCPPDPALIGMLQAILDQVTLIQRYKVPFAYIPSTTHSALSGEGTISVQQLLGVSVGVVSFPSSSGWIDQNPDRYFNLGWVAFGDASGNRVTHQVRFLDETFLDMSPSDTVVTYHLQPGVVVNLQEIKPEP